MKAQDELALQIADRLRRARQRAGLSQTDAARRVGVKPNTICGWESGMRMPRALEVHALCKVYGCTADYLLGVVDYPTRLPVGEVLIDQEVVDRILRARSTADLEDLVDWEPQLITFWQIVRRGVRVGTHRQVQALAVELASHVQKVAPELWREYEGASGEFKRRHNRWSRKPRESRSDA